MRLKSLTDTFVELAVLYVSLLLIAGGLFAHFEGRSWLESLYWAGTTATSTGYGDIVPKTPAGQVIAFLLMHLSIFFIAPMIIVRLIDSMVEDRHQFSHEEQEELKALLTEIKTRLGDDKGA